MIYDCNKMEEKAVLDTAARMCAAARTAPKARGFDNLTSLVLTGAEKDAIADKMLEISDREFGDVPTIFKRDANNLKAAQALVLIGERRRYAGLSHCSLCGFENCGACKKAGARCAFNYINLGIALGSAVDVAAADKIDTRIMFTIGKAAMEMDFEEDVVWHGIPLSCTGKSPFFDREPVPGKR